MYCTRCGKEIRSDQKFCGNCGAKNVNYQEKNNLKEIIEKAAAGEENALETIYNLTYVQGFAIALQMVKNEQDAMDIMQDAYISAFRNLKQIEDHMGEIVSLAQGCSLTEEEAVRMLRLMWKMKGSDTE